MRSWSRAALGCTWPTDPDGVLVSCAPNHGLPWLWGPVNRDTGPLPQRPLPFCCPCSKVVQEEPCTPVLMNMCAHTCTHTRVHAQEGGPCCSPWPGEDSFVCVLSHSARVWKLPRLSEKSRMVSSLLVSRLQPGGRSAGIDPQDAPSPTLPMRLSLWSGLGTHTSLSGSAPVFPL